MKKRILYVIGLAFCQLGLAQETLSLGDAIQMGLARNFDIQIEKGNIEIANNNNVWGEAGRWPSLTLNVNQNNTISDNVQVASPFALQGGIHSNSIVPGITLNWTLFDGFKVKISKRRLQQLQDETSGNASIVISNTIQAIILGYYVAVLESERLEEFRKQLDLSRDKYDYLRVKFDLGGAVTTELLLEEGNYLTDSINFLNQELLFRNSIRDLNVLMAETDVAKTYFLSDSLSIPTGNYEFNELQSRMISDNVDLSKQYLTQALLTTDKARSRSDRMPTLTFNAGISENRGSNNLSRTSAGRFQQDSLSRNPNARFVPDFTNSLSSVTDNYFANFTLSFNLFNGGRIKRAIKNAMESERIGEIRVEELKTSLDRDLRTALDRFNVRKQLYQINDRRERAARTNLELSKNKFETGSINSFDYRDVQNNYLAASIVKLQATYNLIDSEIELLRLTGGLIREYNQ